MKPIAAVVCLVLTASVDAQVRIRTVTEAVRVDVLVTDGRRPIRGLTARDFAVRDLQSLQQIRIESLNAGAVDLILTLDVSDSLSTVRLAALKSAARQVIELLGPEDRIQIVTFNHLVTLKSPFESSREASLAAIDGLAPAGRTALFDAVFAALMSAPPPSPERRTLQVLLSDGDDSASWLTEGQVRTALRRSSVVVYSLAPATPTRFAATALPVRAASGPESGFLRDAASDTGGRSMSVDRPEATSAAFRQVLEEFRQRYVITYTPTREDKGWHPLEVTVRGRRGAVVFARSGYFKD